MLHVDCDGWKQVSSKNYRFFINWNLNCLLHFSLLQHLHPNENHHTELQREGNLRREEVSQWESYLFLWAELSLNMLHCSSGIVVALPVALNSSHPNFVGTKRKKWHSLLKRVNRSNSNSQEHRKNSSLTGVDLTEIESLMENFVNSGGFPTPMNATISHEHESIHSLKSAAAAVVAFNRRTSAEAYSETAIESVKDLAMDPASEHPR